LLDIKDSKAAAVELLLGVLLLAAIFGWSVIGRIVGCLLTVLFVVAVILLIIFYAAGLMQPPWQ
jgi:hypothetical protein